MINEDSLL